MRAVLGACRANKTRVMTNMGVANVEKAAEIVVDTARELGLDGLKVAAVLGDEVTDQFDATTQLTDEEGLTIGDVGRPLVGANAYLGIDAILPAIETDADVIITGRVADPSLFLAPIVAEYGWERDDWARLGQGTMVGHLMECGMQITGGYYADPGRKDVPRPAECGDYQAQRCRRYGFAGNGEGATALRSARSAGVFDARRDGGFFNRTTG
jgi:hypothetical protein